MIDFVLGFAVGALLLSLSVISYIKNPTSVIHNHFTEMQSMIEECESQVPYNKRCILVAQPEQ